MKKILLLLLVTISLPAFCQRDYTPWTEALMPRTNWRQRAAMADQKLIYQMMLNEQAEQKLDRTLKTSACIDEIRDTYLQMISSIGAIADGQHVTKIVVIDKSFLHCDMATVVVSNGYVTGVYNPDNSIAKANIQIKNGKAVFENQSKGSVTEIYFLYNH